MKTEQALTAPSRQRATAKRRPPTRTGRKGLSSTTHDTVRSSSVMAAFNQRDGLTLRVHLSTTALVVLLPLLGGVGATVGRMMGVL